MDYLQDANFWVLISFIVFITLAFIKGRGIILGGLDKKILAIRTEIEAAENMRMEAQELLAQYQRQNKEAQKQAEEILDAAKIRVAQLKKDAQKEISDDINRREVQLEQRIRLMEEKAIEKIRQHAAQLTISATKEIIISSMSEEENSRINKDILKQIASQTLH